MVSSFILIVSVVVYAAWLATHVLDWLVQCYDWAWYTLIELADRTFKKED